MAWTNAGNIRGPQGLQGLPGQQGIQGPEGPQGPPGANGVLTATDRLEMYGGTTFTRKTHAALIWSGAWYNPPGNAFTRLRSTSNGNLVVARQTNNAASVTSNNPRLIAPTDGVYQLSARQTFGADNGAKGCGLGTSTTAGDVGILIWNDITFGRFCTVTAPVYLTAGTVLYPWIWAAPNSGMSGMERGVGAEYSITWLAAS